MERTLEERLREIVVEQLAVKPEQVVRDAIFTKDLRADSLDLTALTMAVEDEFTLAIMDKDREPLLTFGQLVDYVTAKTGEESPSNPYDEGVIEPIDDEDFDSPPRGIFDTLDT